MADKPPHKVITRLECGLTPSQFQFAEAYLRNGGDAAAAAKEANYPHPMVQASRLMKVKAVAAYINDRRRYVEEVTKITYDYKVEKLGKVVEKAIPEDLTTIDRKTSVGIEAIKELNKMQGHYSAEKVVNLNANLNLDPDVKAVQDLVDAIMKENERDY